MKSLGFCAAVALALSAVPVAAESVEATAKRFINDSGFWCAGQVEVAPNPYEETANAMAFRVNCDDGATVANYDMRINKNSGRVTVGEI
jgi:hypothetical protein